MQRIHLGLGLAVCLAACAPSQRMSRMEMNNGMMERHQPISVPYTLRMEATPEGARLVFTAQDKQQVEVLQREVQRLSASLLQGRCPMMEEQTPPADDNHHPN